MNDNELETHGLNAVAAFQHEGGFVLSLMDDNGDLHTFTMSMTKARNLNTVITQGVVGAPHESVLKFFQ